MFSSNYAYYFQFFPNDLSRTYCSAGEWGSGAGKGGGAGGAVREAGGSFGKLQAAREEEYFRKLQRKQLLDLKKQINKEILLNQKLIHQHRESIARLEDRIAELVEQNESAE
ncbi:ATPase inhibitor mai-1, mitochondrial-like [Argiope bruennichi]|uniref:ATPase inhibitor mai-1, mitochondrial-like n=1 Tax=Argiope bruennichi TaxID=94029 RepID=UPI00249441FD|nr:ATPase inhibitor mai-1, mitochondrial-like [Argiope bruennichi]